MNNYSLEIVTNRYDTLNKVLDCFVDSIVWKKEHVVASQAISDIVYRILKTRNKKHILSFGCLTYDSVSIHCYSESSEKLHQINYKF